MAVLELYERDFIYEIDGQEQRVTIPAIILWYSLIPGEFEGLSKPISIQLIVSLEKSFILPKIMTQSIKIMTRRNVVILAGNYRFEVFDGRSLTLKLER